MAEEKCIISEGVRVNGRLSGSGTVQVEGHVEGNVVLEGTLVVLESGTVLAEVETEVLSVKGRLEGDVIASERISLEAGSLVVGNLKAPRILIAEGAKFKGNIDMDVDLGDR